MGALDSLYRAKAALWAPYYANREQQLGVTATLLNFGDQELAGKVNATTFVGKKFHASGLSPTWTPSEALSAFDTPFDLTDPDNWQGLAPILTLNGTDEEADSPDAAYWSRVADVFSVGAWVNLTDATSSTILSKYDAAGNTREWIFGFEGADKLTLDLYDESVSANPNITTVANTALVQGVWVFVVATYDGSADASGINVYQDGALVASTDDDDANFVNLEDLAGTVKLGHIDATPASIFDGKMAGGPFSPFFTQIELTAEQIANLYDIERHPLGV